MWQAKGGSLNEIRYEWTYEDLLHANAMLDMAEDMETAVDGLIEIESKQGGNSNK